MRPFRHLTAVALLGLAPLAHAGASPCGIALASLAQGDALHCAQTEHGIALSHDAEQARMLAWLGEDGARRFERHFARAPARHAILEMEQAKLDTGREARLRQTGFAIVLQWRSHARFIADYLDSITRATEAAARASGADQAQTLRQREAIRKAQQSKLTPYFLSGMDAATVAHELGHRWYVEAFWPGTRSQGHYGGPGPDWMDEAAAVLMEPGDTAEERRAQFRDLYRGHPGTILGGYDCQQLTDLPALLASDHPNQRLKLSGMQAMTISQVTPDIAAASAYYLQARLFADFLLDRGDSKPVFAAIATAFAREQAFAQWLAQEGPEYGLPPDVPALTRDWQDWLRTRFGPPG